MLVSEGVGDLAALRVIDKDVVSVGVFVSVRRIESVGVTERPD